MLLTWVRTRFRPARAWLRNGPRLRVAPFACTVTAADLLTCSPSPFALAVEARMFVATELELQARFGEVTRTYGAWSKSPVCMTAAAVQQKSPMSGTVEITTTDIRVNNVVATLPHSDAQIDITAGTTPGVAYVVLFKQTELEITVGTNGGSAPCLALRFHIPTVRTRTHANCASHAHSGASVLWV